MDIPANSKLGLELDDIEVPEYLSPSVDLVFKMIFGEERNKDILTDFLKAVLEFSDSDIEEITICDPQQKRRFESDKLEILDVKLTLSNGKTIDIEMQVCNMAGFQERIQYYQADMIVSQLSKGEHYTKLKSVITIIVADFNLFPETTTKKCHSNFRMLEKNEHFEFSGLQSIHLLELPKVPKAENSDSHGILNDWLSFIKAKKKEDFMLVAEKSPLIKKAVEEVKWLSADEYNRELYKARLKNYRDEQARIEYGEQQGWNKGYADGINKGINQGIKEGINQGINQGREQERSYIKDLLAQGLSAEEILKKL